MLINPTGKEYRAGQSAARRAIKAGFPRWTCVATNDPYKCIDDQTGLPILKFAKKSDEIEAFAVGANDEILRAIDKGLIAVDFRPLLLSLDKIRAAFEQGSLGILSPDNPQIEFRDVFSAKLRSERVRKMHGIPHDPEKRNIFIELRNVQGKVFRDFDFYDRPVELALALDNRVLVSRTDSIYSSHDLETSQILNRYPL